MRLAHLTLEDAGGAGRLDAQGVWDGQPVAAKGTLGTLAEAVHPTSPFPLDLSVSLPGLDLGLRGTIAEPADGRGLDLRLVGQSDDIAPLLQLLGRDAPAGGAARWRSDASRRLRCGADRRSAPQREQRLGRAAAGAGGERRDRDPAPGRCAAAGRHRARDRGLGHHGGCRDLARACAARSRPDRGSAHAGRHLRGPQGQRARASRGQGRTARRSARPARSSRSSSRPPFRCATSTFSSRPRPTIWRPLGTMIDVSLPPGAFSYTGRLTGDPDQWTLAGEARLGETAIEPDVHRLGRRRAAAAVGRAVDRAGRSRAQRPRHRCRSGQRARGSTCVWPAMPMTSPRCSPCSGTGCPRPAG